MNEYDYCQFVDGIQYGVKEDDTEKPFAAVIGVNALVDFSGKKVDILSHIDGFPVTLIDERAFSDCSNIKEIILPNTITVIEGDAFERSGIKHIKIPDSVTAIDAFAFYKCENLKEIIFCVIILLILMMMLDSLFLTMIQNLLLNATLWV